MLKPTPAFLARQDLIKKLRSGEIYPAHNSLISKGFTGCVLMQAAESDHWELFCKSVLNIFNTAKIYGPNDLYIFGNLTKEQAVEQIIEALETLPYA